jgi:hypothetical protein
LPATAGKEPASFFGSHPPCQEAWYRVAPAFGRRTTGLSGVYRRDDGGKGRSQPPLRSRNKQAKPQRVKRRRLSSWHTPSPRWPNSSNTSIATPCCWLCGAFGVIRPGYRPHDGRLIDNGALRRTGGAMMTDRKKTPDLSRRRSRFCVPSGNGRGTTQSSG